jgi:hypothetical protein
MLGQSHATNNPSNPVLPQDVSVQSKREGSCNLIQHNVIRFGQSRWRPSSEKEAANQSPDIMGNSIVPSRPSTLYRTTTELPFGSKS